MLVFIQTLTVDVEDEHVTERSQHHLVTSQSRRLLVYDCVQLIS